ncbi:MAG: hypothetical protein KAS04_06200 [Candidatus Aenigmarchaeota archaeon]|nr:hypothetical protein [Candidatus Aenigmarchaeota archaeon]
MKNNTIIWVEDRSETVLDEIIFCEKQGFRVEECATVHGLAQLLKECKNKTALVVIDIMLYGVMDLDPIGIKGVYTDNGYRAGWAIIKEFLRSNKSEYIGIPILVVSSRLLGKEEKDIINKLPGSKIEFIEKGGLEWKKSFRGYIEELARKLS